MEISRERFLDDGRTYHLTIGVRSRTTEAHSLLTSLSPDERQQVSAAMVTAMDQIEKIIRPHLAADYYYSPLSVTVPASFAFPGGT